MTLDRLLFLYEITSSPHVLRRIIDEFPEEEIMKEGKIVGLAYYLFKKSPYTLTYLDAERTEEILELFIDEYKHNVSILDQVKYFISYFDLLENPILVPYIKKLIDITIKYHQGQGFEITAMTVDESDIREMIFNLLSPLTTLPLSSCEAYLKDIISELNAHYIMSEINILEQRQSKYLYKDMIFIMERIISIVSEMEFEEPDYDSEDYNPLEDNRLSKEEVIERLYNNIPFVLAEYDKLDTMKFISSIRDIMIAEYENEIYSTICFNLISPFIEEILNEKDKLSEVEVSPPLVIRDIDEIGDLLFRLPRVLYLTDGRFTVNHYLDEPLLHIEYKVLKDLEIIEHKYSSYSHIHYSDENMDIYEPKLKIHWDILDKLIPSQYGEEDYDDNLIHSPF